MNSKFKTLQDDEVVSVSKPFYKTIWLDRPIFKFGDLRETLIHFIQKTMVANNFKAEPFKWFGEGVEVEVLKYGSSGWKKGKIRIQISLEFCSDDAEVEEITGPQELESLLREPESPLDDIRRMMDEPNS
ncbi:hypothetical protein NG799_26265 [Laspinema sp. D1]|uniref:KGK family protein n=1 Tax=Laspinema palackyanum D2a TaxID=2953684 RepID=A0ABT2MYI6_9CYAN|nr:hypothetical protein [Laspinema sp. D2a]